MDSCKEKSIGNGCLQLSSVDKYPCSVARRNSTNQESSNGVVGCLHGMLDDIRVSRESAGEVGVGSADKLGEIDGDVA